jgi:hypothetical protein
LTSLLPANLASYGYESGKGTRPPAVRCPACGAKPKEKCELNIGPPRPSLIQRAVWRLKLTDLQPEQAFLLTVTSQYSSSFTQGVFAALFARFLALSNFEQNCR